MIATEGEGFFALTVIAMLVATIVLVGIWSVFGTGRYLFRLGISHLAGIAVGAGFVFGLALCMTFGQRGPIPDDEFVSVVLTGMLLIPPISVAVQLPFWFFRAVFGWQFVFEGRKPALPFTLRELFTFTFVVALAFATPQIFARINMEEFNQYENDFAMAQAFSDDGTIDLEGGEMSPEEIKQQQNLYKRQMRDIYLGTTLSSAIMFVIFSILAVPVVLFIFRPVEPATGCLFSFLYSIVVCIFILLLILLMNGGAIGPFLSEIVGYVALAIGTAFGAGAVPLLVTRSTGFRLTSPKRYERELRFQNQRNASESPTKVK